MELSLLYHNEYFCHLAHTKKCQGTGGADVKTFPCDECDQIFLSNRERVLHICNREASVNFYASFSIVIFRFELSKVF